MKPCVFQRFCGPGVISSEQIQAFAFHAAASGLFPDGEFVLTDISMRNLESGISQAVKTVSLGRL